MELEELNAEHLAQHREAVVEQPGSHLERTLKPISINPQAIAVLRDRYRFTLARRTTALAETSLVVDEETGLVTREYVRRFIDTPKGLVMVWSGGKSTMRDAKQINCKPDSHLGALED